MNHEHLKRHADLVDRMASATGVDLEEAALRGRISLDEIADSVLRCVGCADPDHCQGVLARKGQATITPPGYCRNSDLLARLRA